MKPYFIARNWLVILSLCCTTFVFAQDDGPARRGRNEKAVIAHTLTGDFKVEDKTSGGSRPSSFQIVLYNVVGRQIARQSVMSNSRYTFANVENGDYNLSVEVDGVEALRLPIRVDAVFKSDIRRDVALEWRGAANANNTTNAGVVSAKEFYDRAPAHQKLFDKAMEAVTKKDHKQAISLFNQIVGADAKDFPAWTELGTAYFKQEKMGDAEKAFRNALQAKPDFLLAQMNLGKLQFTQKNYEAAIETFTKAVEANPQSAEANMFLGESYLQIKKGSKAVGHLYKALELDPMGMAEAHLRLGTLYRGAGMKEKAVAEFEQFLQKKPDYPDKQKLQQYISENK